MLMLIHVGHSSQRCWAYGGGRRLRSTSRGEQSFSLKYWMPWNIANEGWRKPCMHRTNSASLLLFPTSFSCLVFLAFRCGKRAGKWSPWISCALPVPNFSLLTVSVNLLPQHQYSTSHIIPKCLALHSIICHGRNMQSQSHSTASFASFPSSPLSCWVVQCSAAQTHKNQTHEASIHQICQISCVAPTHISKPSIIFHGNSSAQKFLHPKNISIRYSFTGFASWRWQSQLAAAV